MNYYYEWANARGLTDEQATYIGNIYYDTWNRQYVAGVVKDPPEYPWDMDDSVHGSTKKVFLAYDTDLFRDDICDSYRSHEIGHDDDDHGTTWQIEVVNLKGRYFQYNTTPQNDSVSYPGYDYHDWNIKEVYPYVVTTFAYADTPEEAYKESLIRNHKL